MLIPLAIH